MKIQLNDIDRRLIERICEKTGYTTGIDEDGWVEVDTLLAHLDELDNEFIRIEERIEKLEETIRENHPDTYFDYSRKVENILNELDKQWNFIKERGLEKEYENYNN